MTQRKLTDEELKNVMAARKGLRKMCPLEKTSKGHEWWVAVLAELDWMANYATTDGKPYVDPEPPIPYGYRLAVAGDEGRTDCKIWCLRGWHTRDMLQFGKPFCDQSIYIVPIDCVPTDEEAKSRPEVMVLDCQTELWEPARLLAVIADSPARLPFIAQLPEGWVREYRDCRFPYPGERVDGRSLRLGE